MRASDSDRDQVADRLREALAEGRLSPEEHAERLDAVYAAKTYAELEPLVQDLPGGGSPGAASAQPAADDGIQVGQGGGLPAPSHQSASMVAIFGAAERKNRWLVEPHTSITTLFGGVELDFRRAVLSQREVTLNIVCVFGGVEITVPPGVRVVDSGAAVFGARELPGDDPMDPNAPVIRLTGLTLFGGVDVKRRPVPGGAGDLRERQREIRQEFKDRSREAVRDLRLRQRELRVLRRFERRQRRRG